MVERLKISVHRDDASLHLKLAGNLDEPSAQELVDILQQNSFGVSKVFIHTGSLETVVPGAQDILKPHLDTKSQEVRMVFTGEKAGYLAPTNSVRV